MSRSRAWYAGTRYPGEGTYRGLVSEVFSLPAETVLGPTCRKCREDGRGGEVFVRFAGGEDVHLCCVGEAPSPGMVRPAWFAGLRCEPATQEPPAGWFEVERVLCRWELDEVLLVGAAARNLFAVRPVRKRSTAGEATPFLRVVSPQTMERELLRLRADEVLLRLKAQQALDLREGR